MSVKLIQSLSLEKRKNIVAEMCRAAENDFHRLGFNAITLFNPEFLCWELDLTQAELGHLCCDHMFDDFHISGFVFFFLHFLHSVTINFSENTVVISC